MLQLFSKNLVRRRVVRLSFCAGHLTSARQPLEAPTSAIEWAQRKKTAEDEIELHKQVVMRSRSKERLTARAADKFFRNSYNTVPASEL